MMIIVDTSIWVDHLRTGHPALERLLDTGQTLGHPWVIGEIAMGQLTRRREVIGLMRGLPQAVVATADELLTFVDQHQLYGSGIGYVDAQLLASTRLTADARLWTGDRRLAAAARRLDCAVPPAEIGATRIAD